jgi:hypothetical protein
MATLALLARRDGVRRLGGAILVSLYVLFVALQFT